MTGELSLCVTRTGTAIHARNHPENAMALCGKDNMVAWEHGGGGIDAITCRSCQKSAGTVNVEPAAPAKFRNGTNGYYAAECIAVDVALARNSLATATKRLRFVDDSRFDGIAATIDRLSAELAELRLAAESLIRDVDR